MAVGLDGLPPDVLARIMLLGGLSVTAALARSCSRCAAVLRPESPSFWAPAWLRLRAGPLPQALLPRTLARVSLHDLRARTSHVPPGVLHAILVFFLGVEGRLCRFADGQTSRATIAVVPTDNDEFASAPVSLDHDQVVQATRLAYRPLDGVLDEERIVNPDDEAVEHARILADALLEEARQADDAHARNLRRQAVRLRTRLVLSRGRRWLLAQIGGSDAALGTTLRPLVRQPIGEQTDNVVRALWAAKDDDSADAFTFG